MFILKEEAETEEYEQSATSSERSSASSMYSRIVYMDWINEEEEIEFDIVNIDPELLRMPDFFTYVAVQIFLNH